MTTNDYHAVKGICPSPSGEARWGLKFIRRSNLFLPFGKVRMGLGQDGLFFGFRLGWVYVIKGFSPRGGCQQESLCLVLQFSDKTWIILPFRKTNKKIPAAR